MSSSRKRVWQGMDGEKEEEEEDQIRDYHIKKVIVKAVDKKLTIKNLVDPEEEITSEEGLKKILDTIGSKTRKIKIDTIEFDVPFTAVQYDPEIDPFFEFCRNRIRARRLDIVLRMGSYDSRLFSLVDSFPARHVKFVLKKERIHPSMIANLVKKDSISISNDCTCCCSQLNDDQLVSLVSIQPRLNLRNVCGEVTLEGLEKVRKVVEATGHTLQMTVSGDFAQAFGRSIKKEVEEMWEYGRNPRTTHFRIDGIVVDVTPIPPVTSHSQDGSKMSVWKQSTSFLGLPQEAIEMVIGYLDLRDRMAVMSTCRHLQEDIFRFADFIPEGKQATDGGEESTITVVQTKEKVTIDGFFGGMVEIANERQLEKFIRVTRRLYGRAHFDALDLKVHFSPSGIDVDLFLQMAVSRFTFHTLRLSISRATYDTSLFLFIEKTSPQTVEFHMTNGTELHKKRLCDMDSVTSIRLINDHDGRGYRAYKVDDSLLKDLCKSYKQVDVAVNPKFITAGAIDTIVSEWKFGSIGRSLSVLLPRSTIHQFLAGNGVNGVNSGRLTTSRNDVEIEHLHSDSYEISFEGLLISLDLTEVHKYCAFKVTKVDDTYGMSIDSCY